MHGPRQGPPLTAIPTLALISQVTALSASPSSSQPDPHLDSLLAISLECTVEPIPPPSLTQWVPEPPDKPWDDAVADILDQVHQTTVGVRAKGMDTALLWVGDSVRALVAASDEEELNLSVHPPPPPLLRASPLGLYVRRTALAFAKLDFAETVEWWAAFEKWCDGREPAGEHQKRREVPSFARARLQQDYHAARELVRTFVPAGRRDSTAQQALLQLALIEYEDGGFEAAQLALDEATQVARTVGDAACLAACSSFRLRLEAASTSSGPLRNKARAALTSPHDLLWDISQRSSSDTPLSTLFPQLYLARAASQQLAFPQPPSAPLKTDPAHGGKTSAPSAARAVDDPSFASACHVIAAGLWDAMGIAPLARLHDSIALALDDPYAPSWDVRLCVLERWATHLVAEGRPAAARRLLLQAVEGREKRRGMGVREVARWRGLVERVEVETARRSAGSANEEEKEPPYARLTRAATTAHLSSLAQREPSRLSALITLVAERQAAGGPSAAKRGLADLEEAWVAVLALEEGSGAVEDDGERRLRAREARVNGLVRSQGKLAPIEELLTEVEQVAQRYLVLGLPLDAQRVLVTAAKLADHLALSATPPDLPTAPSPWIAKRDALAQQWLALERGDGADEADQVERERAERVGRVVALVGRAVDAANR